MNNAAFVFPAIRGVQAQHEYYISMVPLDILSRLFMFVDEELPPEVRAQRVLNKARIPEIKKYILSNPQSYVFSALTVSVDGDMEFQSISSASPDLGNISIGMTSRFLLNDGQHRRAAIVEAIKENPSLRNEQISVVFYKDEGLTRSQQMFSDLNKYAIKPSKSINILFNSRDESSVIAKEVIEKADVFSGLVEKEKTTISNRAKALFTLSAICTATTELLKDINEELTDKVDIATAYWEIVGQQISDWKLVKSGLKKSFDVRNESICSLSITLVALGTAGNALIKKYPNDWKVRLQVLGSIDWSKNNPEWDNLVFVNGKVAANRSTQCAMSAYLERILLENEGE